MNKINHKKDCKENIRCTECGRSACINCTHKGMCVVCTGEFKESEINLYEVRPWLKRRTK